MSFSENITTVFAPMFPSVERRSSIQWWMADKLLSGDMSVVIPSTFFECPVCETFSKETVHHTRYFKSSVLQWQVMKIICHLCGHQIVEFTTQTLGGVRETTVVPDIGHVREGFEF